MLLLMIWTQRVDIGKLVANTVYDMSGHRALAKDLIERGMAREVEAGEVAELHAQVQSLAPAEPVGDVVEGGVDGPSADDQGKVDSPDAAAMTAPTPEGETPAKQGKASK